MTTTKHPLDSIFVAAEEYLNTLTTTATEESDASKNARSLINACNGVFKRAVDVFGEVSDEVVSTLNEVIEAAKPLVESFDPDMLDKHIAKVKGAAALLDDLGSGDWPTDKVAALVESLNGAKKRPASKGGAASGGTANTTGRYQAVADGYRSDSLAGVRRHLTRADVSDRTILDTATGEQVSESTGIQG